MGHDVGISEGIDEINYKIILNNLNNFDNFRSKKFYVCGNPWTIGLRKKEICEGTQKEECFGVFLYAEEEERPANWVIVANFIIKIIPAKCNSAAHEFKSGTFVFDSGAIGWGNANVISWKTLVDPNQSFIHNDTCKIIVNVSSSPLQHAASAELIELIPIKKWCDSSTSGTLHLKVNRTHDFVNVCSPEITLGNSRWRFVVCKTQIDNGMQNAAQNEYILQLKLYNSSMGRKTTAKSIKVSLTCKMTSSEPNVDRTTIDKMENKEFRFRITEQALRIISWNELFDPMKKFIENDSFTLYVCLQVSGAACQRAERVVDNDYYYCNSNANNPICPICLDFLSSKLILVPVCGHAMCMDCSVGVLEQKPKCPTCNIQIDRLQRVYLSTE